MRLLLLLVLAGGLTWLFLRAPSNGSEVDASGAAPAGEMLPVEPARPAPHVPSEISGGDVPAPAAPEETAPVPSEPAAVAPSAPSAAAPPPAAAEPAPARVS